MLQQVKTGRLGTTVAVEEIKEEEEEKEEERSKIVQLVMRLMDDPRLK